MHSINTFLDWCKSTTKSFLMRPIARFLNQATNGKLSPDTVTFAALLMHIPIALLIANDHLLWAALLLIIFGLFDALDGELARLQNSAGTKGMLLDSVTDRMKEIILYIGIVYYLVDYTSTGALEPAKIAAIAVAACGGSVLVSYVNAWGDAVMNAHPEKKQALNQTFRGGLMRFEVRITLIVIGLLTGWILPIITAIAALAWFTAFDRLQSVIRRLG